MTASILDYLRWRGDLPWTQVPPANPDWLIMAQLSYILMDGLAPEGFDERAPLKDICEQVLSNGQDHGGVHQIGYMWADNQELMRLVLESPRYAELPVTGYQSVLTDDRQFAAVTFLLPGGMNAVCYRGTDDTVIGWKEDCALAFDKPVPSQTLALEYLERAMDRLEGPFVAAGHSKGGNLAFYAASLLNYRQQARILSALSLDGPGLHEDLARSEGCLNLGDRARKYVPQNSVVGMIFENAGRYTVVRSAAHGIMQHSAFSWNVTRQGFELTDQKESSRRFCRTIKAWLDGLDIDQRREFVETLFETISSAELKSVDEVSLRFFLELPALIVRQGITSPQRALRISKELLRLNMESIRALKKEKPDLEVPGDLSGAPAQL